MTTLAKCLSKLPGPRSGERQRLLFETRLLTHGLCRYLTGDFMEEALAALSGAQRLKTDSRCTTCPDLRFTEASFFESKSVGRTDEAIVYEVRLRRDADFCQGPYELYYWFWHHRYKVSQAETCRELYQGLADSLHDVLVVNFTELLSQYGEGGQSPKLLNNAYAKSGKRVGWGSKGYGMGWNVAMKPWRAACTDLLVVPRLRVYDTDLNNITVRFHPSIPATLREAVRLQQREGEYGER